MFLRVVKSMKHTYALNKELLKGVLGRTSTCIYIYICCNTWHCGVGLLVVIICRVWVLLCLYNEVFLYMHNIGLIYYRMKYLLNVYEFVHIFRLMYEVRGKVLWCHYEMKSKYAFLHYCLFMIILIVLTYVLSLNESYMWSMK